MSNVVDFPTNSEPGVVKKFLNKPMHETTIGDTLILHAGVAITTIAISLSVQGWIALIHELRKEQ